MLNAKSFLSVDFGAGSLKVAEFDVNEAGGLRLRQYALKSLGPEGSQESAREGVMQKALQELLASHGIRAKDVNVCAPGFHVFSKFVKLPPVDTSKVTQIIQYEAQQNVPFPLAEVVWDYQILGSTPTGELEVLLVAIKTDIVEGLFRVAESSGLRLQLADVSPAALCNAFRYNYGDIEDCAMLLDIGAKTSNLLFFEKGKVYSRSINLGANSITQDFANESKLPWADAEQKKIAEGFVSLGGAYEEPENAHQAAISKIARQFMTRLHIQVNQTMQFYRGQQGGSAPQRLFLSGGASLMPYTAQFFAEKLNVPVEYFNPLRSVQIDPSINLEELARVAHTLGEVVGLGLRNLAHCPVELNLMPESTLNWVQFNQKKPYLMATLFSLVLVVFAAGFVFKKLGDINQTQLTDVNQKIVPLQLRDNQFKRALGQLKDSKATADQYAGWMDDRYYWADVLTELHRILINVESKEAGDLKCPVGLWIEQLITDPDVADTEMNSPPPGTTPTAPESVGHGHYEPPAGSAAAGSASGGSAAPPTYLNGSALPPKVNPAQQAQDAQEAEFEAQQAQQAEQAKRQTQQMQNKANRRKPTGEVTTIYLFCRSVDLTTPMAGGNLSSANRDVANEFINELRESKYFDGTMEPPKNFNQDPNGTFTFGMILKLKRPLKL